MTTTTAIVVAVVVVIVDAVLARRARGPLRKGSLHRLHVARDLRADAVARRKPRRRVVREHDDAVLAFVGVRLTRSVDPERRPRLHEGRPSCRVAEYEHLVRWHFEPSLRGEQRVVDARENCIVAVSNNFLHAIERGADVVRGRSAHDAVLAFTCGSHRDVLVLRWWRVVVCGIMRHGDGLVRVGERLKHRERRRLLGIVARRTVGGDRDAVVRTGNHLRFVLAHDKVIGVDPRCVLRASREKLIMDRVDHRRRHRAVALCGCVPARHLLRRGGAEGNAHQDGGVHERGRHGHAGRRVLARRRLGTASRVTDPADVPWGEAKISPGPWKW